MHSFEVYKDKKGEFRFRFRAGNGEPMFASEAYKTKASALKSIESIRKNAAGAEVKDVTTAPKAAPAAKKAPAKAGTAAKTTAKAKPAAASKSTASAAKTKAPAKTKAAAAPKAKKAAAPKAKAKAAG
jgi:uncharacterized protein YegP (UPF0339 family)